MIFLLVVMIVVLVSVRKAGHLLFVNDDEHTRKRALEIGLNKRG